MALLLAAQMVLLLCGVGQPTTASPGQPAQPPQVSWRAAAREDVIAAYELFRQHHPGMFDPQDRGFPDRLRRGRDAALRFAREVDDAEGHARALALFSAALADGHARVQAAYSGQGVVLWPGFRTVWRGETLHVVGPIEDGPPPGSVLAGCDGKRARTVIREGAFGFYGLPDQAGQWWESAPLTFRRVRSKYDAALPRLCRFRRPDGRIADHPLVWRPVSEKMMSAWFEAEAKRQPVGLSEPRSGIQLITLSTFSPDDDGLARYARLFRDLDAKVTDLAAARAVVLDLRHNRGGSSSWSEQVAEHLWGEAAVKARLADYFRDTEIWWRADKENVDHFGEAAIAMRVQGRGRDAAKVEALVGHLRATIAQGSDVYVEKFGASLRADRTRAEPRRLPPVYVIMDGGCASACLDGLDVFTRFPGVKLVGAPTSAASNYLDVRFQALPSDRGGVVMPTKVWVRRPRRAGEVYRPDIPVNDLDWSTATFLDRIEGDLRSLGHVPRATKRSYAGR